MINTLKVQSLSSNLHNRMYHSSANDCSLPHAAPSSCRNIVNKYMRAYMPAEYFVAFFTDCIPLIVCILPHSLT